MTTRPRFSMRRHLAFMSATVRSGLSSILMSVRLSVEAASAIFTQSLSRRLPEMSRPFSTSASLDSTRVTSCSLDISREKTATALPLALATLSATLSAKLVLPIPGLAAKRMRSDLLRPLILSSTALRPVERPGSVLPPVAESSARWSSTPCSTTLICSIFCALRPRRTA